MVNELFIDDDLAGALGDSLRPADDVGGGV
jgi:hypothetical protein